MKNMHPANKRRAEEAAALWASRKAEIVRRYDAGESQQALADHYGVTLAGMQKAMARLGIPPRPRWRAGAANGRYVHGKATTLYRRKVTKKSCRCGATVNLCVHHKNGDHYDNRTENLEVMCMSCHSRMHKKAWWAARKSAS